MNRKDFLKYVSMMTTGILAAELANASEGKNSGRSVYKIINSSNASMGGMHLKSVLQGNYQNYVSPFFIFDEFGPIQLPKGVPFRVDAHPHAGIIPTTYVFKGNAHHRDSMGNDFQYDEGDFIQFTSGKGALHMEETGYELFKHGGTFHGIQSWLNIPSGLKQSEPHASHIKKEDIATIQIESSTVRVILGEVFGVKSQTQLLMPVIYWHISIPENASLEVPVDASNNAFIYLMNGQLEVNGGALVNAGQAVLYNRDGSSIKISTRTSSDLLVLGGQVNNEPVVASGPFVLNNEDELKKAYRDFENGKFGDMAKTNGIKRQ